MPYSDLEKFINKNISNAVKTSMKIEEMMDSGNYTWAEETLIGIYDYIQDNVSVTKKQMQAVENIAQHPNVDDLPF